MPFDRTTFQFNSELSLYIPKCDTRSLPQKSEGGVDIEETKVFIANQFHLLQIGLVSRVDLVMKYTPSNYLYFIAFVHFDQWYTTAQALELQVSIADPTCKALVQFHARWYWLVNKNTALRPKEPLVLEGGLIVPEYPMNKVEHEAYMAQVHFEKDVLHSVTKRLLEDVKEAVLELRELTGSQERSIIALKQEIKEKKERVLDQQSYIGPIEDAGFLLVTEINKELSEINKEEVALVAADNM